ncbi:monocarboxylate transporter 12-B, partial [Trichonephila inaurata madagascariensis]
PLVSGLVNKYGCRIVSIIGAFLAFIGFLLSLLVPQVEFLFLTIGLLGGVGFGLMYLPAVVSVALHFEKKRATAMGISLSGTGIGSLIMAPLTAWLISYYGYWKGALLILTGLIFNVVVLSCFYRQFGPVGEVLIPVAEVESASEDILDTLGLPGDLFGPQGSQSSRPLAEQRSSFVLRRPSVASNEPGLMHKMDIFFTGTKEAPTTPSEVFQIASPADMSSISTVTRRGSAFASFRKAVAEMLGLAVLKNYAFLIFAIRGCVCLASIVLVEIVGMKKLNNAYGIYLLATGSSTSIGTPVIGLLHDSFGNYDAGFYLNGGLVITGALMLLVVPFIKNKYPEQ